MRTERPAVSSAVIAAAIVVVVVLIGVAYYASTVHSVTTTVVSSTTVTATSTAVSTAISTAVSTAVSTSVSTITTTVPPKEAPLVSYSADAYAPEVQSLLTGFSSSTGVQVAPLTSGGSTADASAIAAGAPDDVFVSSSLSATSSQYLGNLTANWSIGFATDQIVLAYSNATTQTSATNDIIGLGSTADKSNATSDWNNFYTALVSGTVKVGISDPTQDPGGLRAWLALEAAGYMYSAGNTSAYVNALLQHRDNVTGASSAALVAPLQAGDFQFLFIYKSAATGDGLKYIPLDSHVNLGSASLAYFYAKFSYKDSAGVTKGAPIIICITIPLSVVNTAEAVQFVQYVVQNSESLASFGVVPISPCVLYENTPPPVAIQLLVTQGLLINGGALP